MSDDRKPLPPWLMGLILALLLFVVGLWLVTALGYGDEPSVGSQGVAVHSHLTSHR